MIQDVWDQSLNLDRCRILFFDFVQSFIRVVLMERVDELRPDRAVPPARWTELQRETIFAELNRLLADPSFNRSRRCVALLRSLIVHGLDSNSNIKERTLGVEVFGRSADYDTNADPIVRMTANEIRKRLAQYYQNPDHKRDVIIHIESGSYIPNFEFICATQPTEQSEKEKASEQPVLKAGVGHSGSGSNNDEEAAGQNSLFQRKWAIWLLIILVCGVTTALSLGRHRHQSSQHLIWSPVLKASEPLVICVSDNPALQEGQYEKTSAEQASQTQIFAKMAESRKAPEISSSAKYHSAMPFVDARAAQIITRVLAQQGRITTVQQASSITFRDFHRQYVMMVGGFDNPWSVILLTGMRFSFRADPTEGILWIKDSENPTKRTWARSDKASSSDVDYAIIASFYAEELKNRIMVIGGLGERGTESAIRLLSDTSLDGQIPSSIRDANNFEIVIKTYQVNGETAPPQIVAVHTW